MSNEKHVQILDFEKPIYKIQDKIEELKKTSIDTNINYDSEIKKLEEQTKLYKKELENIKFTRLLNDNFVLGEK